MRYKKFTITFFALIFLTSCSNTNDDDYTALEDAKIELGKALFFDTNLSNPVGQACVSCHAPETGYSDPNHKAISEGAVSSVFGNRNAPSLSYNVFSPSRYYNTVNETFVGGLFLDGRSPNLQEQFIHPLLNPLEMNNASAHDVVLKIKNASYYPKLVALYSNSVFDSDILAYVADAISKYETSKQVNPFTSKYDYYLQGRATLTLEEKKGLALFQGKALCANCHITDPDPMVKRVLFTDFTYDNIGVPKNVTNPFYTQSANTAGASYIDLGISAVVGQPLHNGKFRVPTLRNIAISAPYFHNGAITTLEDVVRFYNKRDLNTGQFGPPELLQNMNKEELGNLKLSDDEEQQLVAFLKTLTDGYHR
jgi:cytochrome c peroxidase